MTTFLEERLQMRILIIPLRRLKKLLCRLFPVIQGVSVNDTHVVNTARPSLPEVSDEKVYLLISFFCIYW